MLRISFFIVLASVLFIAGCNSNEIERLSKQVSDLGRQNQELRAQVERSAEPAERLETLADFLDGLKARIHTNFGTIDVEFFPEAAPIHVFNFVSRAESGFYNDTQFHRLIPGFMIQGGDPNSRDGNKLNNGQGGPIFNIPHEFNDITHSRGVLSMARVSDVNVGAGSQFFIMHADTPRLDNQYTVFGRVTDGMDVVDAIVETEKHTDDPRLRDHPVNPVIISSIEVYR